MVLYPDAPVTAWFTGEGTRAFRRRPETRTPTQGR